MAWLFSKRIDTAMSMAGDIENMSVLDFGCGGGVTFKFLDEKNCRITGCESEFFELTNRVCQKLNIKADIYRDLMEIKDTKYDRIFALDVFEHIEDIIKYIDKLKELSHDKTVIIISGPTESFFYKVGRKLAGFCGDYHVSNIYDVERHFRLRDLKRTNLKRLFFPLTLFRVSAWQL